ncbi:MAG: single-stranded DNA-binding protein [Thermoplasmata archaeon]
MENVTKIKDLTPESKRVNVLGKVASLGETKEITTKYGESRKLTEVVIGDETGVVTLTLWGDQSDGISQGDTLYIDNGYITLVRGHIRLNVGKYGSIKKSEESVENVNTQNDISSVEHHDEFHGNGRRMRSGGRRDFKKRF